MSTEDEATTAAWEAAKEAANVDPDPALAPLVNRANYVLDHRPGGVLFVTLDEWNMLRRMFPAPNPGPGWTPAGLTVAPGLTMIGPPTFYGVPVQVDHLLADHQARAAAHWAGQRRTAHWLDVTTELARETAPIFSMIEAAMDRRLHPWRHPDRNPMPRLHLFPRAERLWRVVKWRRPVRWVWLR
jgi:hypothetical protein